MELIDRYVPAGLFPAEEGSKRLQFALVRLIPHSAASGLLQRLQEALLRGHGLQTGGRHAHVVVVLHALEVTALFFDSGVGSPRTGPPGHPHRQPRRR